MVGCVVVLDGVVVGRGHHARYGGAHAETVALADAGAGAQGATLHCTLEPCCYQSPEKHQPPCTGAILASGIRRVVIGQLDPNPLVNGKGCRVLSERGIDVSLADRRRLARRTRRLNSTRFLDPR